MYKYVQGVYKVSSISYILEAVQNYENRKTYSSFQGAPVGLLVPHWASRLVVDRGTLAGLSEGIGEIK